MAMAKSESLFEVRKNRPIHLQDELLWIKETYMDWGVFLISREIFTPVLFN